MKTLTTRVKLRAAFNLLKKDQDEERELIERIIQDIKGKDVSLDQIIERLKEKKQEHYKRVKSLNRIIFQIEKQNEQTENDLRTIEPGSENTSKETRD